MITRRWAGIVLAAAVSALAAGCSDDASAPPGTSGAGSETVMASDTNGAGGQIDRTNPDAVAATFATWYAAGDTPSACTLLNDDGRKQINEGLNITDFCGSRQNWDGGTPKEVGHCDDITTEGGFVYDFRTNGDGVVYDEYKRFVVRVIAGADGNWSVSGLGHAGPSTDYACD